jgi:hypothetical protein
MSVISPPPGLIRRDTLARKAEPTLLHRWTARLLAYEDSELPASIAISARGRYGVG